MLLRSFLILLFLTASCTVQKSSSTDESASPTTTNVGSGVLAQLPLWKRGPQQATDPDDFTLDSTDSLESVPRQSVSLYDLNSVSGKLSGPNLNVFYSKSASDGPGKNSPTVSSWINQRIPWDSKEFKAFMLYAHGSRAIRYMIELYPNLNFSVRGKGMLPLHAFSSVDDNPLKTKYEINKDGRVGNILFFQDESASNVRFNPADESDAIYHEFAHAFQHALNPNVLETGGNYDVDMLLEGMADFFAASAIRDDRVLEYLSSNAKHFFTSNSRTGTAHQRKMGGSLRFPESYVGDFHLDARIISNALNDIRKYLEGETVALLQNCGSACSVKWSTSKPMNRADAFDMANILAHDAYREIIPSSSIIHYSEKIVAAANRKSWATQCGSSATCKSELVSEITSILKSRGILTGHPIRSTPFVFSGSSPELVLNNNGTMFFAPLFSSSRESNTDNVVDRCEAILAVPNIRLRSGLQASAVDTLFELYDTDQSKPTAQVTGFSSLDGIDRLSQKSPYFDIADLEIKLWGFLVPGESIGNLAAQISSRYYTPHQLSVLSPLPNSISDEKPSPLGWAVRAPATAGASGYIEFAFSTRPYEVRYVTADIYTIRSLKQKLTVSTTGENFCN